MSDVVDMVADAIEGARCLDREGPYGIYITPDGKNYIRDFRDPKSPECGKRLGGYFSSRDDVDRWHDKLTRRHIAEAAIAAYKKGTENE